MRQTFQEAGWRVATEKVQYGLTLDLLGLGITSEGDGAMFVPEAKRRGMIEDISACQHPEGGAVGRAELDRLVGRASHLGQVAAEANAYLQPMYRMLHAKVPRRSAGRAGVRKVKPRKIRVCGTGRTQRSFQKSLAWFKAALGAGVSVPLAPRVEFPSVGEEGCVFLFTDAAREAGAGFGAFSVVQWEEDEEAEFLYLEQRWDDEVRMALQANVISMPAGEAFGAVVMADALLKELQSASHIVVFTDSEATEAAINSANSPSPQLNVIVQWLFSRWPKVQVLGVWQQGVRNAVADRLSRRGLDEVLAEARRHGLRPRRIQPDASADQLLVEVWSTEQAS
jgi:ribonuclease HI